MSVERPNREPVWGIRRQARDEDAETAAVGHAIGKSEIVVNPGLVQRRRIIDDHGGCRALAFRQGGAPDGRNGYRDGVAENRAILLSPAPWAGVTVRAENNVSACPDNFRSRI